MQSAIAGIFSAVKFCCQFQSHCLNRVGGELIVIVKYSIYSQSCSELAVTYHSLNEGNQHSRRSADFLGLQDLDSWRHEERYC